MISSRCWANHASSTRPEKSAPDAMAQTPFTPRSVNPRFAASDNGAPRALSAAPATEECSRNQRGGSFSSRTQAISLRRLSFDQFDFVPVRILDECDHRRPVGHRTRFADDLDAFLLQFVACLTGVGHADRQMAECIPEIVALGVPVVRQLYDGMVIFVAVTHKGEREFSAREIFFAQ